MCENILGQVMGTGNILDLFPLNIYEPHKTDFSYISGPQKTDTVRGVTQQPAATLP